MTTARRPVDPLNLGPNTEALFARAFAGAAQITAKAAAELLGMDTDTLRDMTDAGLIRAVRKGKVRSYIEADLRGWLAEGPDVGCRTLKNDAPPPRGRSSASGGSRGKVVPFSARQAGR